MMKCVILFHDNCFDGLASASLFRAFVAGRLGGSVEFEFGGLAHAKPGEEPTTPIDTGPLGPARLSGDLNAIVDFRYLTDPRLHWWFDHHESAFGSPEMRRHFEEDDSGMKYFDPRAPSCAGFISRMLSSEHGFEPTPVHRELVRWADIIDSARFPSPRMAVELKEPALRLMTWIENSRDFGERVSVIERMSRDGLDEIAGSPFVSAALLPILETHWELVEFVRGRHEYESGVVFCDLTDRHVDAINKFIPYYLHPDARYAVVVTRSAGRTKVGVGYSPWAPREERAHDISKLCERHGGGGHAVVGAVSLAPHESEQASAIGLEMARILRS